LKKCSKVVVCGVECSFLKKSSRVVHHAWLVYLYCTEICFSEVYNVVRQVSSCKVSISMDLNALPEDFACGSSPFYRRRSHVSLAKHIDHDHLLYYYLNRKLRLHVNFEGLETLTLIVEKEKEIFTHHCHYNFFN
jgi:hypothetical protein